MRMNTNDVVQFAFLSVYSRPIVLDLRWSARICDSNPDVILGRALALHASSIEHPARLDQQQLHFFLRIGLVFDTLGYDKHFSGANVRGAIPQIDPQLTFDHDEGFFRLSVVMPDKVAL